MKKYLYLVISAVACSGVCLAQTTREEMAADPDKTGGVYYAYPSVSADNTPAPKGFSPFHISHYGRHGSRYLIGDRDYTVVSELLHKADSLGALTERGIELKTRLDSVMVETAGRGGDLSPLGRRQHHDIAARMYANYPEVFTENSAISARSTLVPRCILSMASFCESLKERNPRLYIDMESSNRYMPYICYSTPESNSFNAPDGWWEEVYRKFVKSHTNPGRLVSTVFSDARFVSRYVNPEDFMWSIYWLASDAQNTECRISFHDFFTSDELFDLWQCFNSVFYARHADFGPSGGVHLQNAAPLLRNIIETADAAIESNQPSAALRFGHDGNVVPLTSLMHLRGCDAVIDEPEDFYKGWCDWKVTPMAANIQMIFYRNKKKPETILVKILHNERETSLPVDTDSWPYYDWKDVKAYFQSVMK